MFASSKFEHPATLLPGCPTSSIAPELIAAKAQRDTLKQQQTAKQREAAINP